MPTAELDIFKALFLEALEKEAKGNMPRICHSGFFFPLCQSEPHHYHLFCIRDSSEISFAFWESEGGRGFLQIVCVCVYIFVFKVIIL